MSDNELLGGAVIMSVALFTLCGFSFSSLLFLYLYHSLLLFCLSPSFLSRLWSGCTVISQHCRLHLRVMTHTLLCTRSPFPAFLCVRTHTHVHTRTMQSSLLCHLFPLCPLSISQDADITHTHTRWTCSYWCAEMDRSLTLCQHTESIAWFVCRSFTAAEVELCLCRVDAHVSGHLLFQRNLLPFISLTFVSDSRV